MASEKTKKELLQEVEHLKAVQEGHRQNLRISSANLERTLISKVYELHRHQEIVEKLKAEVESLQTRLGETAGISHNLEQLEVAILQKQGG